MSREARCLGQGEDGYGAELRTVWRHGSEQNTLCHHFSLSSGKERYKIDGFRDPAPCD